ncbi:hypothetical protein FRB96_000628 [Tulasnella sp. 330]|nr:hypothetical protein FRB96_000628 [Tulasnella sp. 330]
MAQHDRRRSVTTAASLFGESTSSSLDFFATTAQEEPTSTETARQFSHHPTQQAPPSDDAAGLFSSSEYDTNGGDLLWDQAAPAGEEWLAQTEEPRHNQPLADSGANYEEHSAHQDGYIGTAAEDPYASQGWYDEHGQWHAYTAYPEEHQQTWANEPDYNPPMQDNGYPTTGYDYGQANYEPAQEAAPAASTVYASNAYSNGQVYAAPTTYDQAYDPYKPVATTEAYAPSQSSAAPTVPSTTYNRSTSGSYFSGAAYSSQSPYDPYAPTKPTANAPPPIKPPSMPTLSAFASFDTPQPNVAAVSSQEAASKYRTTSYNAYDPPILDRSKKGLKGHHAAYPPPPPLAPIQLHMANAMPTPAYNLTQTQKSPPRVVPPPPPSRSVQHQPQQQVTSLPAQAAPSPPRPPPQQYNNANTAYDPYAPSAQTVSRPPQNGGHGQYAPPQVAAQYQAQPEYSSQDWNQQESYYADGRNGYRSGETQYTEGHNHSGYQPLADSETSVVQGDPADRYNPEGGNLVDLYDPEGGEPLVNVGNHGDVVGQEWGQQQPVQGGCETSHPPPAVHQSPPVNHYAPPKRDSAGSNYAPSKRDSAGSNYLYNDRPASRTGPPKASAPQMSPTSSLKGINGMNGSARVHSPPSSSPKSMPRTKTPGSIRSTGVSSPDIPKGVANGTHGSPRPLSYQATGSYRIASPSTLPELPQSRMASPVTSTTAHHTSGHNDAAYDPYQPSSSYGSFPVLSPPPNGTAKPYAPMPPPDSHNGAKPYDPYAPFKARSHMSRQASQASDYSAYDYPAQPVPYGAVPAAEAVYAPRTSMDNTTYIPSASQTGGDDLLGRTGKRIPIVSFGFGGKLVTCFHSQMDTTAGFDVSLLSRKSSPVVVRTVHSVMDAAAAPTDAPTFPGPLFADPGPPSVNITRTTASSVKAKKAAVLRYLEARIDEVEKGLAHVGDADRGPEAGKLALLKLLKIMLENDGKLSGSPEIDQAVRSALVPRLEVTSGLSTPYGFSTPAAIDGLALNGDARLRGSTMHDATSSITYPVRSTALDKLQEHLLRGERQQAYRHALDEKLWAHAMIISSSMDKDAWKEVADEFIRTELGVDATRATVDPSNGRESLRVAYSLFAGQGAAAVNELLPPKPLVGSTASFLQPLPPSPKGLMTPISDAVNGGVRNAEPIPGVVLSKWPETAATIKSNTTTGDSAAMTALGDALMRNKWPEAAHAWYVVFSRVVTSAALNPHILRWGSSYLLSLQTSLLGGAGAPSARVTLLGSECPDIKTTFHANADALICSEILEFALSLAPLNKGQEPFSGVPHLQAYRLLRAIQLSEAGHINIATRYCEAIGAAIKGSKLSPYFTLTFQEQLKDLLDRLSGTPQFDKNGSWIARKMTKPSLATLGSWIETGVTKFIAGEGEEARGLNTVKSDDGKKDTSSGSSGPFAQYTVISSANNSPNASSLNLNSAPLTSAFTPLTPPQALPRRSGSALAFRSSHLTMTTPMDRAVSAMDVRQTASADAATTTFGQDAQYPAYNGTSDYPALSVSTPNGGNWWDTTDTQPISGGAGDLTSTVTTPTAAETSTINTSSEDTGSFVSPMDSLAPSPSPGSANPTPRSLSAVPAAVDDDDDDLGFGNNANKKGKKMSSDVAEQDKAGDKPESTAQNAKAATSDDKKTEIPRTSSWLPWKWGAKKEEALASGPGPVKAKLGDDSSFYYDKELKRWVNKKAGDTTAAPASPPPPPSRAPSRAQTTSPGSSGAVRGATPPPRPQSQAASTAPTPTTSAHPPTRSRLAESYVPDNNEDDVEGSTTGRSLSPMPSHTRQPSYPAGLSPSTGGPPSRAPSRGPLSPLSPMSAVSAVSNMSGMSGVSGRSTSGPPSRPASRLMVTDPDLAVPQRSTSAAGGAKKKAKNRYVDVFAAEQSG